MLKDDFQVQHLIWELSVGPPQEGEEEFVYAQTAVSLRKRLVLANFKLQFKRRRRQIAQEVEREAFAGSLKEATHAVLKSVAHHQKMGHLIVVWQNEMKAQWSRDLLDSSFRLPSGRVYTWGNAPVSVHEKRVALVRLSAAGQLEGAARHQMAVDTLTKAGVQTLNELT